MYVFSSLWLDITLITFNFHFIFLSSSIFISLHCTKTQKLESSENKKKVKIRWFINKQRKKRITYATLFFCTSFLCSIVLFCKSSRNLFNPKQRRSETSMNICKWHELVISSSEIVYWIINFILFINILWRFLC